MEKRSPNTSNVLPNEAALEESGAKTSDSCDEDSASPEKTHDSGLLLIAIFKLAKCAFFFSLGVGAVHFLHKDLGDEALRLATALRFDTDSKAVQLMLDKIDLIDDHRLREIGFATFGYSAVALTEGIGLLLERTWAEYLTLILTVSFVPWELFELVMRPSLIRVAIFLINLAVLWYLIWLLQRKGTLKPLRSRTRRAAKAGSGS